MIDPTIKKILCDAAVAAQASALEGMLPEVTGLIPVAHVAQVYLRDTSRVLGISVSYEAVDATVTSVAALLAQVSALALSTSEHLDSLDGSAIEKLIEVDTLFLADLEAALS